MLSNQQIKHFKSLQQKKFRDQHQCFIAEGDKLIHDLLDSDLKLIQLYYISNNGFKKGEEISKNEMSRISGLKTHSNSFAVFEKRTSLINEVSNKVLILDDIQDPGNLGTLIRLCDWFGFKDIICSKNTVDVYNPKVIQSTMGSLRNVNVFYEDLSSILQDKLSNHIIFGTYMEGSNVKESEVPEKLALVLGNEGQGISPETSSFIQKKISIPPSQSNRAESLNVAVAGAIVLNHFS